MLEKYPNCKENHVGFSSRCVKKTKAVKAAQQSRKIGLAGRVSTMAARDMATATGSNRVRLRPRPKMIVKGGGDEKEMADVDEEEQAAWEARDITMAKSVAATWTMTDNKTVTETGALPTNDLTDPAQLRRVIQMDH